MYWEDADWCRRAHDLGLRVEYEPSLIVIHHQGSSSSFRPIATVVAFHRSALRYWRLHGAGSSLAVGLAALSLAAPCSLKLLAAGTQAARSPGRAGRGGSRPARRRS